MPYPQIKVPNNPDITSTIDARDLKADPNIPDSPIINKLTVLEDSEDTLSSML